MEDQIYPSELILLHLFLGLPVYTAFFATVLIVQKIRKATWLRNLLVSSTLFVLSAGLALLVWAVWPFQFDIIQAQFIHIPATVACLMVFGLWSLIERIKRRF